VAAADEVAAVAVAVATVGSPRIWISLM